MAGFVLIVDDRQRLEDMAGAVFDGGTGNVKILAANDVLAAKRKLIQAIPDVVLCFAEIAEDMAAGVRFCNELQQHPELCRVPVVLFSDCMSEELLGSATKSGAKALIEWPLSLAAFREKMVMLFPEMLSSTSEVSEPSPKSPNVSKQVKSTHDSRKPADTKLQCAQQLLAKVLHNLKTSDLLSVVEIEDVPRVVYEMTRSVCDIRAQSASEPAEDSKGSSSQVELDLDSAFGLKK